MKPCLLILLLGFTSCQALNILGIYPYHGKSHFLVFRVFLRELANRGHNVTVISHYPEKNPPKNYHDISLAGSIKVLEGSLPPVETSYWSTIEVTLYVSSSGRENCEVMLANKQVQDLVKEKPKFDVVVVEQFNSDCSLGVAYKLKAPVVGTTSNSLMPFHFARLGVPYNPSYVSFLLMNGGTKPTLWQRIESVVFDFYFRMLHRYVTQRSDQNTLAKYFDDIPPLEDLAREIKFFLLYSNFILTGSKLLPANVIEVGGYHVGEAKPLTGDLQKFVESADHGVVYISFGSVVKSSSMPSDKVTAILEAIKVFPQRFIWKWEDATMVIDKNKVFISSWLPQVDILGHPKVLAFISHAGLGGTIEGLNFGVPIIAMPLGADQPSNAAAIEESGLGVRLHFSDLNKENFVAALKKVLEPGFREQARKLSRAWHDRPMSPLDTAVYWTEFAARHSNFTFRTPAADVPLYQYINLDIICVFLIPFVLLYFSISLCLRPRKTNKTEKLPKKNSKKSKRE